MESLFLLHETILRQGLPLLAFVIFAAWETFRPRRPLVASTAHRWINHAILSFLGHVAVSWTYRLSGVMVASAVAGSRYGVLNRAILP